MDNNRIVCTKCGKEKPEKEFFMKKDHTRCDMCKTCLTLFIDNKDPSTFLGILEKFDVPYIEDTGINLANKIYLKNPGKFGSASVIGQYLRAMNMAQYRDYNYADTDRIAFEAEKASQEAQERRADMTGMSAQEKLLELQQQLDAGEISQAEFNTMNPMNQTEEVIKPTFIQQEKVNEESILSELNDEEIHYLKMKGGLNYKPSQGVSMEDLFVRYENEFDLNADREETLKQICKVKLKMDEALDIGDLKGYRDLANTYDQLRKSGKFTEAQNKEESAGYLDSIGELVRLCEKKGGIIEQMPSPDEYPQDKVDFCIKDMKQYTYNLVTKELGLGNLIESYIEKLEQQQKEQAANAELDDSFILSAEDEEELAMTDQEAEEFSAYLENEIEEEAMRLAGDL